MILKFIIYGCLGWIGEVIFTGTGSLMRGSLDLTAHTYLWMFPIYGLAAFLDPIRSWLRNYPLISRGTIWAALIFTIEYLSGWLIKSTIGFCPWDYSSASQYAVHGFIRLDYFLVWFTVGLLFEKITDFINKLQISYGENISARHISDIILLKAANNAFTIPKIWRRITDNKLNIVDQFNLNQINRNLNQTHPRSNKPWD